MASPTSPESSRTPTSVLTGVATPVNEPWRDGIVRNRAFILSWRLVVIAAALAGIALVSKGNLPPSLVFFTIQSNILVVLCMGYLAWTTARGAPGLPPPVKSSVAVYIAITGLVYNLVLARLPSAHPAPGAITVPVIGGPLGNDLVHIVTPVMVILDWLLFDGYGDLRWRHALIWIAYPVAYEIFALVRGALIAGPSRYPYPFLDVDKLGYGGVALNTVIYGVAFWLLGILFVAVDHGLARLRGRAGGGTPALTAA